MSDRKRWLGIIRQIAAQGWVKDLEGNVLKIGHNPKVGLGSDKFPCLILGNGDKIQYSDWGRKYTL